MYYFTVWKNRRWVMNNRYIYMFILTKQFDTCCLLTVVWYYFKIPNLIWEIQPTSACLKVITSYSVRCCFLYSDLEQLKVDCDCFTQRTATLSQREQFFLKLCSIYKKQHTANPINHNHSSTKVDEFGIGTNRTSKMINFT